MIVLCLAEVEEATHRRFVNSWNPKKETALLHLFPPLRASMPGAVDRMELSKVSTEADEDSTDSLDDRYTEPIDPEKGTIDRSATAMSSDICHLGSLVLFAVKFILKHCVS